jgi:hypothetical protein
MKFLKNVNRRSFVSLLVLLTFFTITVTSILMFSQQYDSSIALVHTVVGFSLILVVIFHIKNNFTPLKKHAQISIGQRDKKNNLALPVTVVVTLILTVMAYNKLQPMLFIYEWGNTLRAGTQQNSGEEFTYKIVDKTRPSELGPKITIDLRQGPYFAWPQYAIWIEDMQGDFIQPLFVTSKLASNNFINQVNKIDSDVIFKSHVFLSGDIDLQTTFESGVYPESKAERARPESLPVFLHKYRNFTESKSLIPDGETAIADAYSGATMTQSFLLKSNLKQTLRQFKVRFEINNSFDFNDYYSSDRFTDDAVYSGNGYSAQPSLIYEALIDLDSSKTLFPMNLLGRGHHSGRNGVIYKDLQNMTTALELVDRIIVEINYE